MGAKPAFRKVFSCVAAAVVAVLALCASPAPALADYYFSQPYVIRGWEGSQVFTDTRVVTAERLDDVDEEELNDGWYVADESYTYSTSDRWEVLGTVNLIIKNGVTITCKDGIHVPGGKRLNIYFEPGETGRLVALSDSNSVAAIGGDNGESGGEVNIYGGTVIADAYNDNDGEDAAGIGGGNHGNGGTVRVYGGTVEATGANYGAGIGSGDADGNGLHGGSLIVFGGTVTARGGTDAAGIGGGEGGRGADVQVWGGSVNAIGGNYGAGIGSGDKDGTALNGGSLSVYGGTVTAQGGSDAAGIGGGCDVNGGSVTIEGGTVTATGGPDAAGIGGGDCGTSGSIRISGGNVTATGGANGAGIGSGNDRSWDTIEISGGTVVARGGNFAAGIGSGDRDSLTDGGTINISGGDDIQAYGGCDAAGIGGGESTTGGNITISGGNVRAYGGTNTDASPDSGGAGIGGGDAASGGKITITGGSLNEVKGGIRAAGIGGGDNGNGGTIEIGGDSLIQAFGGDHAAGIGGGDGQNGGSVTVTGGNVTATGGESGAGIGGSDGHDAGNVTINGGEVHATGGANGAGIGGGNKGAAGTVKVTDGKVIAKGGTQDPDASHEYGGAGIGSGGKANNGSGNIDISGGDVTATGGLKAAGIGGGFQSAGGTINIGGGTVNATGDAFGNNKDEGNNNKVDLGAGAGIGGGSEADGGTITIANGTVTAQSEMFGAGIGGGYAAKSGTIHITGGNVTARGGGAGAGIGSGYACDNKSDAVDVTIDGGVVSAYCGGAYWYYYRDAKYGGRAGAAVGAGGSRYKGETLEQEKLDQASYFSGTIRFNGGETYTYDYGSSTIGTSDNSGLVSGTGKVEFNGGRVLKRYQMGNRRAMVKANEDQISINGNLSVLVSNRPLDASNTGDPVDKDQRIRNLMTALYYVVFVQPCEHRNSTYVNKGVNHEHTCKHCELDQTVEEHTWSEPAYEWGEDNVTATASRSCPCGAEESETVETQWEITDDGSESGTAAMIYTATFKNPAFEAQTCAVAWSDQDQGGENTLYEAKGGDTSWTKGSTAGASFRFERKENPEATFEHFSHVEVDGKRLAETDYEAVAGSVVITLKPAFLETLSVGDHTLKALFDDTSNSPEATFKVLAATADGTNGSDTATNSGTGSNATGGTTTPAQAASTVASSTRTTTPATGDASAAPALATLLAAGLLAAGVAKRRRA